MAVILIIEQHQAPFSAFEPTALQHDDSVSTNLPFHLQCVVTSLKLNTAETDVQQGVRKAPPPRPIFAFPSAGRNRLLSREGGSSRQAGSVRHQIAFTLRKPCQSLVMLVNKGGVCPSSLFPLPQKYIWYVIGPCNPCMSLP
jgi:hypothetical protein